MHAMTIPSKRNALGRLRFGRRRSPKAAKTKRIFRQTKRMVREPGRKPLKSLGAKSSGFAELFVFQALSRLFASHSPACALSTKNPKVQPIAGTDRGLEKTAGRGGGSHACDTSNSGQAHGRPSLAISKRLCKGFPGFDVILA
jgi:hypothetical protein